ncbi:MAG: zinc-ribbon domain-containing protein [Hyalangium sp.]|uniref:zinc-ribbon domain-containing protein n=1 Tax=Hyalangium sp. TaxID=2028555 RepID=UPI00389ADCB6
MIVKCEQCQTRFKIPDEKVTDKGVKVRCTKCGHTFRVTRESAASASGSHATVPPAPAPAPSGGGFDPFERFGAAPEPPKGVHVTRPGFFAEGVEASRPATPAASAPAPIPPAPWNSADSGVEEDAFHETTRVMPIQVPVEARPPVPSLPPLPFDLPPVAPVGGGLRQNTPAPGQGLPGAGAVSFKPSASSPGPLPGVPSIAPPTGARGLPTPAPVKLAAPAAQKALGGAAPRPLAPPAIPVPTASAGTPASGTRPVAKPGTLAPAPANVPGASDLFSEFFANPAGGATAPLPDLPPPELPPVAASPAQAWPAAPSPSFAPPDDDPFGSVSGELGEVPQELGAAPEFDPTAMFSDPAPVPVAPPMPSAVGRSPSVPPTPAPISLGRPGPQLSAPAAGRLPPSPAFRAAPPPPAPAPAPARFPEADPFGPSNADLSEPSNEFGFGADPEPAPAFAAPEPAPLGFSEEDPFGSGGVELGSVPEAPTAPAPAYYAAPEPMPAPAIDEFGPSFGSPAPMEQAAPSAPAPSFVPPGPMDFGMIGDDQMSQDPSMGAPGGMPDPFAPPEADPFAPPSPAGGMPDPFAAQGADPFAQPEADPFAQPEADPFARPEADPFAAPAPAGGMEDPFAAQASQAGMQDPFAAQASQAGMSDPFAAAEPAFSPTTTGRQMLGTGSPSEGFLTQTDTSHQVISPTDTGRQLLDLPQHSGAEPAAGEEFNASASRELIDLPRQPEAPPPAPKSAPTLASPAIARPAGRPADMGIPERRKVSAAQQVTSQVAYLTIAAGLLLALTAVGGVYMKEGHVDAAALSPGHLIQLLTPSQFVPHNVSNGLYDTRGANPIFYVRGEAENRSSKPVRVKVVAGLYDGDQRVKSVEGLAGAVPSPEDLHAVTSAEAAGELRLRLDKAATVVPPGGRAPFTLVFQEYPQDLSAFRLQVTLEPAPEEGSKP